MASVRDEVERQILSNRRGLAHQASFRSHRERTTALLLDGTGELCVLGAGNCLDLDLERLAGVHRRIHLVDLDQTAITKARARQPKLVRNKLVLHAPIDLSGCHASLERWRDLQATPEELLAVPARIASELARQLPGPFQRVLSTCLLTQLLHTVRGVLGERHPLFQAVTLVVTLGHLRSLAALTAPEGEAWLTTDVSAGEIAPLPRGPAPDDQLPLLEELLARGQVFQATAPGTLAAHLAEDPVLSRGVVGSAPSAAWLWHNGPERVFLVYAMRLTPRP